MPFHDLTPFWGFCLSTLFLRSPEFSKAECRILRRENVIPLRLAIPLRKPRYTVFRKSCRCRCSLFVPAEPRLIVDTSRGFWYLIKTIRDAHKTVGVRRQTRKIQGGGGFCSK